MAVFGLGVLLPSLSLGLQHHCSEESQAEHFIDSAEGSFVAHTDHLAGPCENEEAEEEACDCPYHHQGCHHVSSLLYIDSTSKQTWLQPSTVYADRLPSIKPDPDLDGLFQPPRRLS